MMSDKDFGRGFGRGKKAGEEGGRLGTFVAVVERVL